MHPATRRIQEFIIASSVLTEECFWKGGQELVEPDAPGDTKNTKVLEDVLVDMLAVVFMLADPSRFEPPMTRKVQKYTSMFPPLTRKVQKLKGFASGAASYTPCRDRYETLTRDAKRHSWRGNLGPWSEATRSPI